MTSKRIFGIDLGTTYSCIAYVDDNGKAVVVPNADNDLTTPSVVHFESAENIVVGKQAKNAAKIDGDRVAAFVKRSMGDPSFAFAVDGKQYKPEEVSSFVLRKLVGDAAQALGEEISDVVITCPAYFGANEREATRNAGKLAGLNVRGILNEPTAAAICYGSDRQSSDKVVLVYDLGGGTFDITMIAIKQGSIEVIYTDGNHNLGGKDWDDRLTNYFAEEFMAKHPTKGDPRDDAHSLQDIANIAEEAKKALSQREKYPLMVTHGGERARVEITREKLEELTADLLEQTIELTKHVLEEAKKKGSTHVDQILLVGGLSKMPCVARRLKETVGIDSQSFEPDLAVAKGAALMGLKILAGELIKDEIAAQSGTSSEQVDLEKVDARTIEEAARKASSRAGTVLRLPSKDLAAAARRKIVNVCSKGFGVVVVRDETGKERMVAHLIHNNTAVPAEVTETGFGTLVANQRSVHVQVMEQAGQAESPSLDDNHNLCEGEFELPGGLPAGAPIHITFRLEEDGTLKLRAVEPSSGRELKLEAKAEGVMSQQEVEEKKGMLLKKPVS